MSHSRKPEDLFNNEYELNERHKMFVDEYIANGYNGKAAYLKVYTSASEVTAEVNSSQLLSLTKIQRYLDIRQRDLQEELGIRKKDLIDNLIEIMTKAKEDGDLRSAIAAIGQTSKMLGFDAPKLSKVELEDKTEVKKSIKEIQDAIKQAKESD